MTPRSVRDSGWERWQFAVGVSAATGLMEQRKKKVPVFLRQAIRQGIGVTIAVLLGYAIADTLGGSQQKTGVQWLQGCKWAAITVVVVASPMLGKVSQVGLRWIISFCLSMSLYWFQRVCHGRHGPSLAGDAPAPGDGSLAESEGWCGLQGKMKLRALMQRELLKATVHSSSCFGQNGLCAGIYGADDGDCLWRAAGAWDLTVRARLWTGLGHALHRSQLHSSCSLFQGLHKITATLISL